MNNNRKPFFLLFLLSGMFLLTPLVAECAHATDAMPRASNYIDSCSAGLSATGSGNLSASYSIRGTSIMSQLGVSQIQIQEWTGSTWRTAQTYSSSSYPSFMAYNALTHSGNITYRGISGHRYRASITFYAAKSGGSDSQTKISSAAVAY